MRKLPKYFYSSFERIQNLKEYFGDALDLRNNHELLKLAKRIVIITPHDRKYYSTMWQKDRHYNRTIVLELNKVKIPHNISFFQFLTEGNVFSFLTNFNIL